MKTLSTLLLIGITLFATAQSPVGKWVTVDDNTGKDRSVIEIKKNADGTLSGTITKLFRSTSEEQDPICDKCKGKDKDKKVIGLTILKDMKKKDDVWTSGTIMDPESGSTYDCKMWFEGNKLMVRGYLMFFYRTQSWKRYQ